jgi:hypothetical protein
MKNEKRKKPILSLFFLVVLSLSLLLSSCGIEKLYYIDYIPQGEYNETNAIINLPSDSVEGYRGTQEDGIQFDNFMIFYRIYISDSIVITGRQLEGYGTNSDRTAINAALNSDYNQLYSLTDITNTNVSTSSLENTFCSRRYFLLTLVNADDGSAADINRVLGSGSLGQRLEIAFPPNPRIEPTLTINGASYNLRRAVENEILNLYDLNPAPDRRFLNADELFNPDNITNGRNADVATNSAPNVRLTYVSMYIAARGTNLEMPPRIIYSQPTFIGIFRLANSS